MRAGRDGGGVTEPTMEDVEQFRAGARVDRRRTSNRGPGAPRDRSTSRPSARSRPACSTPGFTGFMFPTEYGGQGLTIEHQKAFFEESAGYVMPGYFGVSIGMLGATILDCGTEEQKARHLPAILRADEIFVQLLSEPSGGSDLAGALSRATRDGDTWVINGSKIWTSGGDVATHGLMLARTDWNVPKHRGLSMFIVPLGDHPGVTIEPILQVNGEADFCQEFFDDVTVPFENLLGAENEGWGVAQRLLFNERNTTAGIGIGHGYMGHVTGTVRGDTTTSERLQRLLRRRGAPRRGLRPGDPPARRSHVRRSRRARVRAGTHHGRTARGRARRPVGIAPQARRGHRLSGAHRRRARHRRLARRDLDRRGTGRREGAAWISARGISIGGGSNEMQRNIVSERLLGLPREHDPSRELAFSEIQERRRQARRDQTDLGEEVDR